MTTKAELTVILNKVGKVYGQTIDTEKVNAYNFALGNLPRFRILRACMRLMQTNTFFPRPSEIISEINRDTSALPSLFDEACHWIMFSKGVTDPSELTEKEIFSINEKFGLGNEPLFAEDTIVNVLGPDMRPATREIEDWRDK